MPRSFLLTLPAALLACQASANPRAVAEAFWEASQAGDVERARELVAADSRASLKQPDRDSQIGEVTFGAVTREGGEAAVETSLVGGGGQQFQLTFPTVLVLEEGAWKVDLDRTTGEMTKALLGSSLQEIAEQMGEGMGEAMEGMAEELQEGMMDIADSIAAARKRERDK